MKYLGIVLLTALVYSCGSGGGQSSPKQLFEKAHQAVLDNDIAALSECITVGNGLTAEMSKAYAELIIYVKSGDYQKMRDTHKDRLNETKTYAVDLAMMQAFGVPFMPDFDVAAEKGVFDTESRIYTVDSKDQPLKYVLDEKEGKWTFWVSVGSPSDKVIGGVGLLKELETALTKSTAIETSKAIEELIIKHIKPTELQYAEATLSGKMSGVNWTMTSGKVEQQFRNGKGIIKISFSSMISDKDCRLPLDGSKILMSFASPGTYDFGQTGENLTLYYDPAKSNKVVVDGKVEFYIDQEKRVAVGKIAAKLDDDNYVSGTFEVPFCGDIILD